MSRIEFPVNPSEDTLVNLPLLNTAWNLKDQIAAAPSEQDIPVLPDSL